MDETESEIFTSDGWGWGRLENSGLHGEEGKNMVKGKRLQKKIIK